jgi:carboxyl-terminal processing protease
MKKSVSIIFFVAIIALCFCSKEEFGGLGIEVPAGEGKVTKENPYKIVSVFKGGTGETAGLKTGDEIISVNGVPLEGFTYNHIVLNLLRGKVNTFVNLEIRRDDKVKNFRVRRGKIVLE